MNRLICILGLVLCLGFVGCKKEKPVTPQEQIAGRAAVQHHDFASFVDGVYYGKPIPKDYRALLEKNAEIFVHEQDSLRRGIKKVKLSKADLMKNDSTLAAVYLLLSYGDGTAEEVLVPMIKRKDVWYMK